MRLARSLSLITLVAAGTVSPALAQGPWSVFVGGGAAGFGGASEAQAGEDGDVQQFKPTPTTRLHVGAARTLGRGGIALDGSYAKAGLGGYADGTSYGLNPALTLYDLRLLASYEILTPGQATSVRLALGPMLQVWSGDAIIDTQTRLGGATAITMAVPISRSAGVIVSGSLGVAGSPFDAATLSNTGLFKPVTTWTRELAVVLRLSL